MYEPLKDLQENYSNFYKELKRIFDTIAFKKGLNALEIEDLYHDWLVYKFGIPSQNSIPSSTIMDKIKTEVIIFSSKKRFLNYIQKSMETWIIDYLRKKKNAPLLINENLKESLNQEAKLDFEKFQMAAEKIFNSLNLDERLLFTLNIMGFSLNDISSSLKMSRSTVHYQIKKIYNKIKEILNKTFKLSEEKEEILRYLVSLAENWWEENKNKLAIIPKQIINK